MCSDLFIGKIKCALGDGVKDSCVLNILWNLQEIMEFTVNSIMEFTVKEVTVFTVATFLNKVLCHIYFLRNIWII